MVKGKKTTFFDIVIYALMMILAFFILFPIWSTIVTSFISETERLSRGSLILFPHKLDFSAYTALLNPNSILYSGYRITILRAIVGTICNMLVTTLLAYALSKRGLPGRKVITFLIYFTMLFSGGLVPTFLVVRFTGLYNTLGAYIVPGLISAWNLFLMRNFFMQIPSELEEAAIIDGASPPTILFRIYLPLSIPTMVTIALMYAAWHWNSWFDGLIYIRDRDLLTLQNVLRNTLMAADSIGDIYDISSVTRPPLVAIRSAMIVLSTLPILIVSTLVQKYFVKGITLGSIKG